MKVIYDPTTKVLTAFLGRLFGQKRIYLIALGLFVMEPAPRPETDTGSVAVPLGPGATTVRSARRPFLVLGAIALLVAAGIGGYLVYTAGQVSTDDAQLAADVVLIAARVSGQVVRVAVTENQQVKRGELLVELDPADYSARLEQAEAELETTQAQAAAADAQIAVVEATSRGGLLNAEAQVSGSGAAVVAAHAQVAAARAGLARAQSDTHKAALELGRSKALAESGAITPANVDNAQAAYDSAMASEEQANAQVTAAELAETAALLVLRKKADALWGDEDVSEGEEHHSFGVRRVAVLRHDARERGVHLLERVCRRAKRQGVDPS